LKTNYSSENQYVIKTILVACGASLKVNKKMAVIRSNIISMDNKKCGSSCGIRLLI